MMKVRITNFLQLVIIMIITSTSRLLLLVPCWYRRANRIITIIPSVSLSSIYFQNILRIESNDFLSQFNVTDVGLQIARGNVKVLVAKKDARLDLVPIDYVADTILCAAWHVTIHRDSEVKVYNCTSNADPIR